jgi:hypothetical protein
VGLLYPCGRLNRETGSDWRIAKLTTPEKQALSCPKRGGVFSVILWRNEKGKIAEKKETFRKTNTTGGYYGKGNPL